MLLTRYSIAVRLEFLTTTTTLQLTNDSNILEIRASCGVYNMSQLSELIYICGKKLSFGIKVNTCLYSTQLRGGLFSPSEKYSKFYCIFHLSWVPLFTTQKIRGFPKLKESNFFIEHHLTYIRFRIYKGNLT